MTDVVNSKNTPMRHSGTGPVAYSVPAERVDTLTFGVGHGDCMLVEYYQDNIVQFRLLYDGGKKLPPALIPYLKTQPKVAGTPDIDVVVLSHVDSDHQGGLHTLLEDHTVSIGALWLPCLPAFKRLKWLFSPRVIEGVKRAELIQATAIRRNIPVSYPLENYAQRFGPEQQGVVSVISPARRLVKRLYTASLNELAPWLAETPLPLEWLLSGEEPAAEEQGNFASSDFPAGDSLTPDSLPERLDIQQDERKAIDVANAAAQAAGETFTPEFFGNSVLNDTSLVIVIDTRLAGMHRRRIVLAGDQENWSYIAARHPMGLAPDVLKVPHHGGRVYLGDVNRVPQQGVAPGVGQFYLWMRPRIGIVSARGTHNLPRNEFREALRSVGTTLICPNRRGREVIFEDGETTEVSCFKRYNCEAASQQEMTRLSLSVGREDIDAAACLPGSGHRGPAPVVVMQQRLLEPDESFVRWTAAELAKQARWLEDLLRSERAKLLDKSAAPPVHWYLDAGRFQLPLVAWDFIRARASQANMVQFVADPTPVLRYAHAQGLVWSDQSMGRYQASALVASLTKAEYDGLLRYVRGIKGIIFLLPIFEEAAVARSDHFSILNSANTSAFMSLCAAWVGLPKEIFDREVKPKFFLDLIRIYSAKIAPTRHPKYYKIFNGQEGIIYLKQGEPAMTDFFAPEWDGYTNFRNELNDAGMHRICGGTQTIFPPLNESGKNHFRLDLKILHEFVAEWFASGRVRENAGSEFAAVFQSANWTDIWPK